MTRVGSVDTVFSIKTVNIRFDGYMLDRSLCCCAYYISIHTVHHGTLRTDDLYDLYDLYDLCDLFPLQFMISICQAGQIHP